MQAATLRRSAPSSGVPGSGTTPYGGPSPEAPPRCFHCGTPSRGTAFFGSGKTFCCAGCQAVFELLTENGLAEFYRFGEAAGAKVPGRVLEEQFRFLDEAAVRDRLVDFSDERLTRVTFRIPAIHCIACVWLLENLFRLNPGIVASQVTFPRKEVALSFETSSVKLSTVVALLASLGYEPELRLSDLDSKPKRRTQRRLWQQLGVAGFAFGNTMLLSLSSYLGLDQLNGPSFRKFFGFVSLVLAIPVVTYCAQDYWRSARASLRQRLLHIDVPIAAGIAALFAQSTFEVLAGRGEGYFDSLAGLVFFLLCGKVFQQKTYDRLAFDRDYKAFFPLSAGRRKRLPQSAVHARTGDGNAGSAAGNPEADEERISLSQLRVGDRLIIRCGELIPADSVLVDGLARVDYSFVTGESEPLDKTAGDYLYAGGRQVGGAIEVEMAKAVSQSYLTSLWNQAAFRKQKRESLNSITNRYSRRFTQAVLGVALASAILWAVVDPVVSLKAFTSVLIVACPCALALAAPFALGTAQRVLGQRHVFLKSPDVLETLARVDAIAFDKTGTLTAAGVESVAFRGAGLSDEEQTWLYAVARQSTHPHAVRITQAIAPQRHLEPVRSFVETPGCGIEGIVAGREIWMGSAAWLRDRGVQVGDGVDDSTRCGESNAPLALAPAFFRSDHGKRPNGCEAGAHSPRTQRLLLTPRPGGIVHVAIARKYRGCFALESGLRPETADLIGSLLGNYELALLSGDNARDSERFSALFGRNTDLHFNQSPTNKLRFIQELQRSGKTVMMVGDGLNDAGALKHSDVGVAVVEKISAFSPASDVIMAAAMLPRLNLVLRFAKLSLRVVRLSFLISSLYNVVGITIAALGWLSPVVCAILMPLSSFTVAGFACGGTMWLGSRILGAGPPLDAFAPALGPPEIRLDAPPAS